MFEIEIKAHLNARSKEEVLALADDLGFVPFWTGTEEDTYYNGNDRDFRQTDEALRVRTRRTFGMEEPKKGAKGAAPGIEQIIRTETLITYKGPKQDNKAQARMELETGVDEDVVIRGILRQIGCPAVMAVIKERIELSGTGNYEGYHICVDNVKGLGGFIEAERVLSDDASRIDRKAATEAIWGLLALLGIPEEDIEEKTYLEMLLLKKAQG